MECTTERCTREVTNKKRGLCKRCYAYFLRTDAPHKPRCPVEGCDLPQYLKGHCHIHARRLERGGNVDGVGRGSPGVARGIRNMDGRYITSGGYVKIRLDGIVGDRAWVLEHRYVMEQSLGRPLYDGENVHHIDGNRLNNDPNNLELWVSAQPAGQRPEDLVIWAEEILRRYK